MNIDFPELLTVDELSTKLKVPKSWIYSRTRQIGPGTIPRIKVGKYIRFEFEQVLDYLNAKQAEQKWTGARNP